MLSNNDAKSDDKVRRTRGAWHTWPGKRGHRMKTIRAELTTSSGAEYNKKMVLYNAPTSKVKYTHLLDTKRGTI